MRQRIRLTESDLHRMIQESVNEVINEMEIEEGWIGDKWNQFKSAAQTATQRGEMNMKDRFVNAKKNWNTQGELNDINNLISQLSNFVDKGQIDPQKTVAQLIGGKYNNNKFGSMSGMAANRKAQISRRGGNFY